MSTTTEAIPSTVVPAGGRAARPAPAATPFRRVMHVEPAQDVRHPLRLLADGEHRHRLGHRDHADRPAGRPRQPHLRVVRGGHRQPDVDHPAGDRRARGDQRVEPAHRADHLHPGLQPAPGARRQG
ncbi:hypothetical protein G5V59_24870 [Nocardioides sp. W3-2-3]|nr:hypothetical protein [Nocardioides convexus]NHA01816.1 hypothetical protein [Nocardioides convexus]